MVGEDVGSRADFCSCIVLIHAIPGVMQNLHSCHPWQSVAAVKPCRYSGCPVKRATKPPQSLLLVEFILCIPHNLKSAKLLKLGIAA
ncbi:MAG: hypothetical protein CVV06_11230 [Gammaproteobacteria bacterium HGW-Gammaproteobacteria-10]|nr:MAG: hypothetical protein CVV06_11230 [Gammaproteobacteria bacterium HGW-Gammaproteobacteria-10]